MEYQFGKFFLEITHIINRSHFVWIILYGPYDMDHLISLNLQIAWFTIGSKKRTMSKDQATITFIGCINFEKIMRILDFSRLYWLRNIKHSAYKSIKHFQFMSEKMFRYKNHFTEHLSSISENKDRTMIDDLWYKILILLIWDRSSIIITERTDKEQQWNILLIFL